MRSAGRWEQRQLGGTLFLLSLVIATLPLVAHADSCCADCLGQSDPSTSVITYDPLVHAQCSAVMGICCYSCSFSHGSLDFQDGITFDSDGEAQAMAGQRLRFTMKGIVRVTYDFLRANQLKTNFVGNDSTEASRSDDGTFDICVDDPGTIAFRGWGDDACAEATTEQTIKVVAGTGTATCDVGTVTTGDTDTDGNGNSAISAASASSTPQQLDAQDGTDSATTPTLSGENDFEHCNPTRGTVLTRENGSQYCACTGDWRHPPQCDQFSYLKTALTIGGGLATVLSIAFSVRAYTKSRKDSKNAARKAGEGSDDDMDADVLSVQVSSLDDKCSPATPGSVLARLSSSENETRGAQATRSAFAVGIQQATPKETTL